MCTILHNVLTIKGHEGQEKEVLGRQGRRRGNLWSKMTSFRPQCVSDSLIGLLRFMASIHLFNFVGRRRLAPLCHCTMYDFHDSNDIFVNLSFLPFFTQKAPWISSKNRYLGAKICIWPSWIQNYAMSHDSYNTHLKYGAYMHYKNCPKMSVESWKAYIVHPLLFAIEVKLF